MCRADFSARVTLAFTLALASAFTQAADRPSRPAYDKCKWEKLSDQNAGLAAWVQRCDYGFRKIDLLFEAKSLMVRFSDGGKPDPLVDVIDINAGETPQAAIKRDFAANTDPQLAPRCVLAPYRGDKPPAGVTRYTFVPDRKYAKEVRAKQRPDEVGNPPCGNRGAGPDGIQYYEVPAGKEARKVLFVRIGQEAPLFDEKTLRVIAPAGSR